MNYPDYDNLPIYKKCWKCDMNDKCKVKDKFQRLPRSSGGLGMCRKLKEKARRS